jgi:hypothetical protein
MAFGNVGVIDLTPRVWKTKFAHDLMKSDLALLTE